MYSILNTINSNDIELNFNLLIKIISSHTTTGLAIYNGCIVNTLGSTSTTTFNFLTFGFLYFLSLKINKTRNIMIKKFMQAIAKNYLNFGDIIFDTITRIRPTDSTKISEITIKYPGF